MMRRDLPLALLALLFAADLAVPVALILHQGTGNWGETLSGLGARTGPYQQVVSIWLVAFGAGLGFWALAQRKSVAKGWIGLLIWAVGGGIVCGVFPEDAIRAAETLSGKLHGIGAGLGSVALITVAPVQYRHLRSGWPRYVLIALIFVSALGFCTFLAMGRDSDLIGHWQRLYLTASYIAVLWAFGFARIQGPKSCATF